MDNIINYECYKCKNNFTIDEIILELNDKENFGNYLCIEFCKKDKKIVSWYEYFKSFIF